MKTMLAALLVGLALLGCGSNETVSAPASKPPAKLVVKYEGNPGFRTSAKLFVRVIAPNDAIAARGKVEDLSADERVLTLGERELIGYYVAVSRSRGATSDPECGREFTVARGETATATISLPSLSASDSCRVSR